MTVFSRSKRGRGRKGYIKRLHDGTFLAMEYEAGRRVSAVFGTYMAAKSWMFGRGLWVEL